MFSIITE
jgi:hypothetical protein